MRKIRTEIPTFLVIIISIVPKGLFNCPLSTLNCQLLQIPICRTDTSAQAFSFEMIQKFISKGFLKCFLGFRNWQAVSGCYPAGFSLVGVNPQSPKIIPALRDGCAF